MAEANGFNAESYSSTSATHPARQGTFSRKALASGQSVGCDFPAGATKDFR